MRIASCNRYAVIIVLLAVCSGITAEKWFIPVDIGNEVDINSVKEDTLSDSLTRDIFVKNGELNEKYSKKYENLRNKWLREKGDHYLKDLKTIRAFHLDTNNAIGLDVQEFSRSKARIYISFAYGDYRWHHYYILLGNFIVNRNSFIDRRFNLNELEKQYSFSLNGVSHGTDVKTMKKILGDDYHEYAGQSPQYRNIYYEKYGIEIIVQNYFVKYIKKGRPFWMDSNMKIK